MFIEKCIRWYVYAYCVYMYMKICTTYLSRYLIIYMSSIYLFIRMYQYYINPSIRPTIYSSILYIYLIYLKLKQNFNFFCFKTLSYFLNKKKCLHATLLGTFCIKNAAFKDFFSGFFFFSTKKKTNFRHQFS